MSAALPLSATDLFCGAGGTSTGAAAAGVNVKLALNHSPTAIASHRLNHPDATHDCVDLSQVDPSRYFATDLLLASPECTTFAASRQPAAARARQAGGAAAAHDRELVLKSRATGFDMLRWAELWHHPVIIVENIVQWRSWPLFDTVTHGLEAIGYRWRIVYRNALLDGVATSRDRMFLVAWRDGLPAPDLTVTGDALCGRCGPVVGTQQFARRFDQVQAAVHAKVAAGTRKTTLFDYGRMGRDWTLSCPDCGDVTAPVTKVAADVLDADLEGEPVLGRSKPLVGNTIDRFRAGLAKVARPTVGEPDQGTGRRQLLVLNYGGSKRVWPAITGPLNTLTGVDSHGVLTIDRLDPGPVTEVDIDRLLANATYRMVRVHELKRAMGFPADYHLTGNERSQGIQIGMAVAPPTASWLVSAVAATAAAARR